MQRFNNILVATDTRLASHPIVDEAVAIAYVLSRDRSMEDRADDAQAVVGSGDVQNV